MVLLAICGGTVMLLKPSPTYILRFKGSQNPTFSRSVTPFTSNAHIANAHLMSASATRDLRTIGYPTYPSITFRGSRVVRKATNLREPESEAPKSGFPRRSGPRAKVGRNKGNTQRSQRNGPRTNPQEMDKQQSWLVWNAIKGIMDGQAIATQLRVASGADMWSRRPRESPQLTRQVGQLFQVIESCVPDLEPKEVIAVINSLAYWSGQDAVFRKLVSANNNTMMRALSARVLDPEVMLAMTVQQHAKLIWAYAKMGVRHEETITRVANRLKRRDLQANLTACDISLAVWGLATLRVESKDLFFVLGMHIITADTLVATFNAQDVANTVWGFAMQDLRFTDLLQLLAELVIWLDSTSPQAVANVAWAYATLDYKHDRLMQQMALMLSEEEFLRMFKPKELAITVWSFATLGVSNQTLMVGVADAVLRPRFIGRFNALDIAMTAWAYAALGLRHEQLMAAIADRTMRPGFLSTFGPQELGMTAWAFAKLQVPNRALMEGIAELFMRPKVLDAATSQAIANVVWAVATQGIPNQPLLRAVAGRVVQKDALGAFNAQEMAMVAWSFAHLGVHDEAVVNSMAKRILEHGFLETFNAQDISNTAWAFANFEVFLHAGPRHPIKGAVVVGALW